MEVQEIPILLASLLLSLVHNDMIVIKTSKTAQKNGAFVPYWVVPGKCPRASLGFIGLSLSLRSENLSF